MRTTLDLDDDIVLAAKELARVRGISMGQMVSSLARQALSAPTTVTTRNGIPLFPIQPGTSIVTPEIVSTLRDELP